MTTREVAITDGEMLIKLSTDENVMDEVMVVAYGTAKKSAYTGSASIVKGEDLEDRLVSNVTNALAGSVAGVQTQSANGQPGTSATVRIRGVGSLYASNTPLYVLDGMPYDGDIAAINPSDIESMTVLKDAAAAALYGARGANGVILITTKGAKEGRVQVNYNGYAKFNEPTGYMDALDPYDYLVYSWGRAKIFGSAYYEPFEKLYGIGAFATSGNGGIEAYKKVKAYDMQKDVYNESFSHNHDFSISGGTDKTKIYFAANYMDEQGMKQNSYSKRASVSLKVNQKLAKNLDFGLDTRYTQIEQMGDEGTTNGAGSILTYAYRFRPIATDDIRGDLEAMKEQNVEMYGKQTTWDRYSPAARINDFEPLRQRQSIRAAATLNWTIIEGLNFNTNFMLRRAWNQNYTWRGALTNDYIDANTGEKLFAGSADISKSDSWNMRWSNTLSYMFDLGENHRFNVLAGQEVTNSGGTSMQITASYFPANFTKENAFAMINQFDTTNGSTSTSSGKSLPERILSYFGRINYTLMDRYLFTFTMRADGSSKFAPSNRWGYFPAAAFAWRINDEAFMQDVEWIDNLKLRLSYGQVGNDGISSNLWAQNWAADSDYRNMYYNGESAIPAYKYSASQMVNPDLKWETTITRNIGIDFGMWNNRFSGTVDVYWNTTKDLLMQTAIPGITGFTATYDNIGQTSNKGIEIALNGVLVEKKDLRVTAGVNINFNKGNVDELADSVTGLYSTSWCSSATFPSQDYMLQVDSPVGIVRGWVYDGIYTVDDFNFENGVYTLKEGVADSQSMYAQLNGVPSGSRPDGQTAFPGMGKYKDLTGDGIVDDADITKIGDMTPDCTGGFNLNVQWKGFDLGAYFNWSIGNEVYNAHKLASMHGGKEAGVFENKLAMLKNSFLPFTVENGQIVDITMDPAKLASVNAKATMPFGYQENGIVSTFGIEDGSFLRLNTLTLGYTLPKQLTKKFGVSNLRVYGSVYNVFTITGYSGLDPEVNANKNNNNAAYPTTGLDWGAYPRARSFVVGLNLSF